MLNILTGSLLLNERDGNPSSCATNKDFLACVCLVLCAVCFDVSVVCLVRCLLCVVFVVKHRKNKQE